MKNKTLFILTILVLGFALQGCQTTKRAATKRLTGQWQCVVMRNNNPTDLAYTGLVKCYNGDKTYQFMNAWGKAGLAHKGFWKVKDKTTLIENTTFNINEPDHGGTRAEVGYRFADDNTLFIIWENNGRQWVDMYKRIVPGGSRFNVPMHGGNYACPLTKEIMELWEKQP